MARILMITPQLPFPPHQGTSLRNFHIICGLAQQHEVWLLSFLEDNQTTTESVIWPLLARCHQIETLPVSQRSRRKRLMQLVTTRQPDMAHRLADIKFEAQLRRLLQTQTFDIIQIEGIESAPYMRTIRALQPDAKIIFDNHNAETELQRRNFLTDMHRPTRWPVAVYSWIQVRRLRRFERWACRTADAVIAVSEADARHLQQLMPHPPPTPSPQPQTPNPQPLIHVIPNSIDTTLYQAEGLASIPFDLIFAGKMDYRPNVDAVLWFYRTVWPLIVQKRPSTSWAIVGQKPHPRLADLSNRPGITLTGWVDDILPYWQGAKVAIMPFRIGSGTRLKIIEALAAGKAIVSTRVGAEGFPVQHNREILLSDKPVEMAAAIIYLLDNANERDRLGQAGQQFAQNYDWRQVSSLFDQVYAAL